MRFGDMIPGVAYKHRGDSMTPDEEFWDAYREETGVDASAKERIDRLPDFEGMTVVHFDSAETTEWLSIPRLRIPQLAEQYIDYIKLSPTDDVCLCEWVTHPDDVDMPRIKQRRKRGNEHPQCKQHTSIGFLLGFFAWMFPDAEPIEGEVIEEDD